MARPARFTALLGDAARTVEITDLGDGRFEVVVDGVARTIDSRPTGPGSFSLLIDHGTVEVSAVPQGDAWAVALGGRTHRIRLLDERAMRARARAGASGEKEVRASMPGKVIAVLVEPGATVEAGVPLLVIEAMKMENEIKAPRAGTVQEVRVAVGQAVEANEILIVVE